MSETLEKLLKKIKELNINVSLIQEIKENPDYFVMEGGTDGSFGHAEFLDEFGDLMPEIIDFAVECCGTV